MKLRKPVPFNQRIKGKRFACLNRTLSGNLFMMVPMSLFVLLCLYSVVDFRVTDAVDIDEFNALVKNPAWATLTRHTSADYLTFLGKDLQKKPKIFSLRTIFSTTHPNGDLVTEDNFHDRVWQFHLLLSVYFAIEVQPVGKVAMMFWGFCRNPDVSTWKNECINIFVEYYRQFYVEIKKMQQSLLYFSGMVASSVDTSQVFTNTVYDTLNMFAEIVENKQLTEQNITDKFKTVFNGVEILFKDQTYPSFHFRDGMNELNVPAFVDIISISTDTVHEKAEQFKEKFNTCIQNLAQSNASYGFLYDSDTHAASVNLPIKGNLEESMESLRL